MNTDPHTPRATPPRRGIPPPQRHIGTAHPPTPLDAPTIELGDPDLYAGAHRINTKREEIRKDAPSRPYLYTTRGFLAAALIDAALVAAHTWHDNTETAMSPALGTHQVLCAVLAIVAACMWIGRAMMSKECEREVRRDEIAHLRHRRELAEIQRLFATILREGDAETFAALTQSQQLIDSAGRGSVTRLPTNPRRWNERR